MGACCLDAWGCKETVIAALDSDRSFIASSTVSLLEAEHDQNGQMWRLGLCERPLDKSGCDFVNEAVLDA